MAVFRIETGSLISGVASVRPTIGLVFALVFTIAFHISHFAIAAELEQPVKSATSSGLDMAPIDADIFIGGMNMARQWERLQASQLYYEVSQTRIVQSLVTRWKGEWEAREGQVGQIRSTIQNPNIMSLLEMGADMVSQEVFMFADGKLSELVLQLNEIVEEVTSISANGGDPLETQEEMTDFFMSLPKAEIDDLRIPLIVQGFKISNTDRVLDKLDQLEGILRLGLSAIPDAAVYAEGLERIEDSRGTRLAWTLDSDMISWELFADSEDYDPDVLEKVQDLLDGRQICITLGLVDSYFILGLSESAEELSELGTTESLMTHDDMKPVKAVDSQAMTGVSYVSDTYMDVYFQTSLQDFFTRNSRAVLIQLENQVEGELQDLLESIPEDLAWLDDTIGALIPDFKGQTSVSYLTDLGSESVTYNRTEDVVFDALKPLPILEQLGNNPVAFLSFRLQDHPEYFAASRKIVQKLKDYLVVYLESDFMDEGQREKAKATFDKAWPLLTEWADIWEQNFLPALRDGQHAFVLSSGNLESAQWWKDMPISSTPLPLPEIAIVTGFSSNSGMIEAWDKLLNWFDRCLEVVRQTKPDSVPLNYQIPRPVESQTNGGVRFAYSIPDDCPVPQTMAPQAIFTDSFMISSYSDLQAQSLAITQKSGIENPLLLPSEPKASAAYIHLGKLSELALPWVTYGIETQTGGLDSIIVPEEGSTPEIKGQDIIDLFKTLGSLGELSSTTVAGDQRGTITKSQLLLPLHK